MNKLINILVVEDNKERIEWFKKEFGDCRLIVEKTAPRAKRWLNREKWDVIFLDHDLGDRVFVNSDDENTGYQVAKYIRANPKNHMTPVIVHSWNPEGAANIVSVLPHAHRAMFGTFNRSIING